VANVRRPVTVIFAGAPAGIDTFIEPYGVVRSFDAGVGRVYGCPIGPGVQSAMMGICAGFVGCRSSWQAMVAIQASVETTCPRVIRMSFILDTSYPKPGTEDWNSDMTI